MWIRKTNKHRYETVKTSFICNTGNNRSCKKVQIASVDWSLEMSQAGYMNQVLMFLFDNLHPLTTDALTTDSGKWLDVYRLDDVHKV